MTAFLVSLLDFRCNCAAVVVETVETMDCMENFPSNLLTVWTRNYCVEGVDQLVEASQLASNGAPLHSAQALSYSSDMDKSLSSST